MNKPAFQLKSISAIASVLFLFSLTACSGGDPKPPQPGQCEEVACNLYCEFGFATGDDGCEICSCRDEPICPAILCADECSGDRVLDRNGCKTCGCIEEDPCLSFEIYECEEHEECQLAYDDLDEPVDECDSEDLNDNNCIQTKPAPKCVSKDHQPEKFCNPYGQQDTCPTGQHCEELKVGGGDTGDSEGETPSPVAIPTGICVDDMPQECDAYDQDSCPQGFVCEEVARPDRHQEGPDNNSDEPIGGGTSTDPYPVGICVEKIVEPGEICYSSDDCDQHSICTVELGECLSPEPDENGNADAVCVGQCVPREVEPQECNLFDEDSCPEGQHCEDNIPYTEDGNTDPSPFPAQPVGTCVDNDVENNCMDLPIEICEVTPKCQVEANQVLCDCPPDVDCQCPEIAELICVPAEPQPEEHCYSSEDCDSDRLICTVELGECDSIEDLDVCAGKCIPRDMPQSCEQTPVERCEQNPECELLATPGNCDCPDDTDTNVTCACTEELFCHQKEIPVENDLCSTSIPCQGTQQCQFEVCTEDENGEMGECFGHCVDTDPAVCIEIQQAAVSPNGYCVVFPTPCEVPENWHPVDRCPE